MDHKHEDFAPRGFRATRRLRAEPEQGQYIIAQLQHVIVFYLVDLAFDRAGNFSHSIQWQGVKPFLYTKHEGANNGERQWKPQAEDRAAIRDSFDFDGSLQPRDNALHYVEAHAATGEFRNFVSGRESGLQNQFQSFRLGQSPRLGGCKQTLGHGALPNLFHLNTAAVVGYFDDHLISLVVSGEAQCALRTLAGASSLLGGLETMANRIPYQVSERLGYSVENTFVKIGLTAPN